MKTLRAIVLVFILVVSNLNIGRTNPTITPQDAEDRLRIYAYVLSAANTIRPFAAKHQPDSLVELDKLTRGAAGILMTLQQPESYFPFPDLRGKNIRFGEMIERQLQTGEIVPAERKAARDELDQVAIPAIKRLLDEFDAMGITVEALPDLQTLHVLYPDDISLRNATQSMAAAIIAKCTDGKRVKMGSQPNQLAANSRFSIPLFNWTPIPTASLHFHQANSRVPMERVAMKRLCNEGRFLLR